MIDNGFAAKSRADLASGGAIELSKEKI